jgi:hypothetical protein
LGGKNIQGRSKFIPFIFGKRFIFWYETGIVANDYLRYDGCHCPNGADPAADLYAKNFYPPR